ncbi:MAG: HEAT repeat domain-containing protein [Kofleriaceae bacterium]
MTKRIQTLAFVLLAGTAAVTQSACTDDQFSYKTWTKKLSDSKQTERAVTELERLGDPNAIPALGKAWEKQGRPERILQVIIELAKPLTQQQAREQYKNHKGDDYQARAASWDKALPILIKAVEDVDPVNPRSVESARLAAEAMGSAKLDDALEPLIKAATSSEAKPVRGQAILSLGELGKPAAVPTLANILREEFDPKNPAMPGAAIIALGKIKSPEAVPVLVETMYRLPFFFRQVRRALVASGPTVTGRIKAALDGTDSELNAQFKEKHLDVYCGDFGKEQRPLADCQPVSAMDYYASIIAGDLYDPSLVPSLLTALGREAKPSYYLDDAPGPPAQNGVLDALRKIGSPAAAQPVLDLAVNSKDPNMRPMAFEVYSFVSPDGAEKSGTTTGLDALAKIVSDTTTDFTVRLSAATAYARLARTADRMKILQDQAKKFEAGSKEERAKADGAPKAALAAAQVPYDAARAAAKKAKDAATRAGGGKLEKAPADLITAVTETKLALDKVTPAYQAAKAAYDTADNKAKNYRASQRVFETHIARIEIALRCGSDPACYAGTLKATFDDIKGPLGKYISGLDGMNQNEKDEIVAAQIERAMLELGKMGSKAKGQTDALLDAIKSDDRIVRQSISLALPKIAGKDCTQCGPKLDAAIAAGEGKTTLGDLNYETQVLRSYWGDAPGDGAAPAAE